MSEDHGHRFAVYSPTGVHIGLWQDGKIASQVQSENPGNTMEELVTLDIAQVMVAAAYEVSGDRAADEYDAQDLLSGVNLAGYIRALTPTDARAALDSMLAKAREDALREAASLSWLCFHKCDVEVDVVTADDILALIDRTAERNE